MADHYFVCARLCVRLVVRGAAAASCSYCSISERRNANKGTTPEPHPTHAHVFGATVKLAWRCLPIPLTSAQLRRLGTIPCDAARTVYALSR